MSGRNRTPYWERIVHVLRRLGDEGISGEELAEMVGAPDKRAISRPMNKARVVLFEEWGIVVPHPHPSTGYLYYAIGEHNPDLEAFRMGSSIDQAQFMARVSRLYRDMQLIKVTMVDKRTTVGKAIYRLDKTLGRWIEDLEEEGIFL
ncbi:MAG TPA: hypothetical protein VJA46_06855 [Acidimicrobiia bacterium]|nr:hypothetical protein [Acidimicrobiia bacterium]